MTSHRQMLRAAPFAKVPAAATRSAAPRSGGSAASSKVQAKPRVGAVSDPLEREADRVADAVVAGATPTVVGSAGPTVQAKCAACEAGEMIRRKTAEEEDPELQLKAGPGGPAADGAAQAASAVASGGTPLSPDLRSYFEPRFGRDLSGVRIHTDARAQSAATAINARAYTLGSEIAFASGAFVPGTPGGDRLLAHELTHTIQQDAAGRRDAGRPGAGGLIQRDIPAADLPTTPVSRIMSDPMYFENGIERIEFFTAELARLHYGDGTTLDIGLVPDQIHAPFEAVDYRTPRSDQLPVAPAGTGLGTGSIEFIPRVRSLRLPPGMTMRETRAEVGRTIRFVIEPHSNRIVPTEVNTISAPRLCEALRAAEAEFVRRSDAIAQGAIEVLEVIGWILIIASLGEGLLAGGGRAGARAAGAGGAAAGIMGRASSRLAAFFTRLLGSGASEAITVEGVTFGGVRAAMRGTELVVTRASILNASRVAGQGRLVHAAFEAAAQQAARQAGATTARVALEVVQNRAWAAYLESLGYAFEVMPNTYGGFTRLLTRVFTL